MLQSQSYRITGNLWISQRKILTDTQQTLEVDVRLHPDDDGRAGGSHVLLPVSTDEDEGIGHGA